MKKKELLKLLEPYDDEREIDLSFNTSISNIQKYTGTKDNNGKDVFLNDRIKWFDEKECFGTVIFDDSCFWVQRENPGEQEFYQLWEVFESSNGVVLNKKFCVQTAKTGDEIEQFHTILEANIAIVAYKEKDKRAGEFITNSYDVAEWNEKEQKYIYIKN